ncbi:unnamed protein product [Gadus morhua 'NCC']
MDKRLYTSRERNKTMIMSVLPLKKLRRNGRYLFGVILVLGFVAVFHEFVAANTWSNNHPNAATGELIGGRVPDGGVAAGCPKGSEQDLTALRSRFTAQAWKAEYKGRANLHVFEDWCGSSIDQLRKNLHYPLYPHTRTTVLKLAASPQWTNYGLRIFGYLHPYADGEFVFAVSSQANSEFWLSANESPLDCRLQAWVGKTGSEWTAPGEYNKFASQTSRPVWLSAQRKYFFELIHKQGDRATDHVALAWKINQEGLRFTVVGSQHISLYTSESSLFMSEVDHIPQTAGSHARTPLDQPGNKPGYQADGQPCHPPGPDMLREDPRDTFYRRQMIPARTLRSVLPDCSYSPSYIIKGYELLRYQGLQFVHMTYIHPNDYTRLTHMETENSCFYHESAESLKYFGLSRYMSLDRPGGRGDPFRQRDSPLQQSDEDPEEEDYRAPAGVWGGADDGLHVAYDEDEDDETDAQRPRRNLLSRGEAGEPRGGVRNASDAEPRAPTRRRDAARPRAQPGAAGRGVHQPDVAPQPRTDRPPARQEVRPRDADRRPEVNADQARDRGDAFRRAKARPAVTQQPPPADPVVRKRKRKRRPVKWGGGGKLRVPTGVPAKGSQDGSVPQPAVAVTPRPDLSASRSKRSKGPHLPAPHIKPYRDPHPDLPAPHIKPYRDPHRDLPAPSTKPYRDPHRDLPAPSTKPYRDPHRDLPAPSTKPYRDPHRDLPAPSTKPYRDPDAIISDPAIKNLTKRAGTNHTDTSTVVRSAEAFWDEGGARVARGGSRRSGWDQGGVEGDTSYEEAAPTPLVFDPEVVWSQTFQADQLDLQLLRSDWIDLNCNVSGNLLLQPADAQAVVRTYVDKLNLKHQGRYTLVRVVNVEKRVDRAQGSRYLLELELKDPSGQLRHLSHYVYSLIRWKKPRSRRLPPLRSVPEVILCNPFGFQWNPTATVHFIVPVKNQARWVIQLISDMEALYRVTRDRDFSLIIVDYDSTDMDVKKALDAASLPQYEYLKLSGNFQRAAGLQAGVDLITDDHSIVFLCDLHISFPMAILDSIRKHCVEGYMAFAPILMRLDCGATPQEPRGYWEVNGFGLLSVYKSDLLAAGGMNTREFTDRWGGEDWELLDRILQSGLEVERIHLRNFFHYYHSKRGMWNRRTMSNSRAPLR